MKKLETAALLWASFFVGFSGGLTLWILIAVSSL